MMVKDDLKKFLLLPKVIQDKNIDGKQPMMISKFAKNGNLSDFLKKDTNLPLDLKLLMFA